MIARFYFILFGVNTQVFAIENFEHTEYLGVNYNRLITHRIVLQASYDSRLVQERSLQIVELMRVHDDRRSSSTSHDATHAFVTPALSETQFVGQFQRRLIHTQLKPTIYPFRFKILSTHIEPLDVFPGNSI